MTHNGCIEKKIVHRTQTCTQHLCQFHIDLMCSDSRLQWIADFPTTLTFAKSIGWIAILAIVAAVPPQTKGSAIFAALFSGMFKCYL